MIIKPFPRYLTKPCWLVLFVTCFLAVAINAQELDFEDLMGGGEEQQVESSSKDNTGIGFGELEDSRASNTATRSMSVNAVRGNTATSSQDDSIEFGESLTDSKVRHQSADISMDNIYSDRNEIKIDDSVSLLKGKIDQIFADCNCLMKGSCYKGPRLSEKNVNQSMRKAENNFNHQKDRVCSQWNNADRLLTQRDVKFLNSKANQADQHLVSLGKLDKQFKTTVDKHESEDYRIKRARQRAADNSGGGFNWGKLAALGVGAAIGGLGDLDSASQLEMVSGMIADSAEGVEGTSNFRSSANSSLTRLNQQNLGSTGGASPSSGYKGKASKPVPTMKEESYTFTCPDTQKQHTIKVPYFTGNCLIAAKNFAKVNSCNMVNEMALASQKCSPISACGHPQCLEMPPGGSTGGSGDADLDWLDMQ